MRKNQAAFTIIELMVTLAVMAIVLAIAIPSFTAQIQNNRVKALTEDLVTSINFARMEALKRGKRVSVCASVNGTACGGEWTDGWITFIDSAASDTASPPVISNASTDVLRVQQKAGDGADIGVTNNKKFLRYTATGMLGRIDSHPIAITVSSTGCKANVAKKIDINLAGMVSVDSVACTQ